MIVDREEELHLLESLLADCEHLGGRVALVNGGLGTGKTELLHSFGERVAASGCRLLSASGARAEQAIELGVIAQLLHSVTLPDEIADKVQALLPGHALAPGHALNTAAAGPLPVPMEHTSAKVVHGLCAAVLELATYGPVVICVDDLQFADELSLQALLYLQRRIRSARVLMVLAEWALPRPAHPMFSAEIARRPNVTRIPLTPLSPAGLSEVLREQFGGPVAAALTRLQHAASGGNPVLIQALIEDFRLAGGRLDGLTEDALVGKTFADAVVSCLHRWDTGLLHVARGVALLDNAADPQLIGDLVGIGADATTEYLEIMETAGLLANGQFPHPVAREAVVENMAPRERGALLIRAAELLHKQGAPAEQVAGYLVDAGQPGGAWTSAVLAEAANAALACDELDLALRQLQLAVDAADHGPERGALLATIARLEWRRDPAAAARYLSPMRAMLEQGHLPDTGTTTLMKQLLWHGRFDEVAQIFSWFTESAASGKARPGSDLISTYRWLSHLYPATFAVGPAGQGVPTGLASSTWIRTSEMFHAAVAQGKRDDVISGAEYVLQSSRLDDETLEALLSALLALIWFDRPERAAQWCADLVAEAEARGANTWLALLGSVQAEIHLRRGDLPGAVEQATAALNRIDSASWGVTVGAPLAILITAHTAMSDHAAVEELLKRPVPPAMIKTRPGVQYLYARGRYQYAKNHLHAALADFHHCGELLAGWGIDLPVVAPWRADAAQVYRRLGRKDKAREVIEEQMAMTTSDGIRVRGVALRVLAEVTNDPNQRVAMLHQSVDLLQDAGDRYELASSLIDLSGALHARGDFERSRLLSRRALQVAKSCKANALILARRMNGSALSLPSQTARSRQSEGVEALSDAERRVAGLAAEGHGNREISRRLHITVSTVEQHLTRVYRKLKVRKRGELARAMDVMYAEVNQA